MVSDALHHRSHACQNKAKLLPFAFRFGAFDLLSTCHLPHLCAPCMQRAERHGQMPLHVRVAPGPSEGEIDVFSL